MIHDEADMIGLATEHDIISIPKIELHVHFGGNFSEAVAHELAHRHGLDPANALPLDHGTYPARYRDFPDFLQALIALDALVRTPDDVETVAAAFARGQAAHGVIYSEVIVTALSHVRAGITPHDLWAALRSGFATAPETRIGIVVDQQDPGGAAAQREASDPVVASTTSSYAGSALGPIRQRRLRAVPYQESGAVRRQPACCPMVFEPDG